jgi:hypothetical protein
MQGWGLGGTTVSAVACDLSAARSIHRIVPLIDPGRPRLARVYQETWTDSVPLDSGASRLKASL